MQKIPKDIIKQLSRSDRKMIAQWLDCTYQYVLLVSKGERNSETPLGRKIIEAAIALISAREGVKKLIEANGCDFKPSQKKYWISIQSLDA